MFAKESQMFDEEVGKQIVGKRILVGVTYLDSNGNLESQEQLHGIVQSASPDQGISIKLQGVYEGEEWNMPPDTSGITEASPGIYNLSATGEQVENPDYLCTWEVHSPKQSSKT